MRHMDRGRLQSLLRARAVAELLNPGLHLAGLDCGPGLVAECRVGVATQHRLDVRRGAGAVDLRQTPLLGVRPKGDATGIGVDVLTSDDGGGDLVQPPLSIYPA